MKSSLFPKIYNYTVVHICTYIYVRKVKTWMGHKRKIESKSDIVTLNQI